MVAEVQLAGRGKARRSLFLHAVYLKEINPPGGTKGIEWMLLTDLPVEDFVQARVIIEWYRCRWEIETYFFGKAWGARPYVAEMPDQANQADNLKQLSALLKTNSSSAIRDFM